MPPGGVKLKGSGCSWLSDPPPPLYPSNYLCTDPYLCQVTNSPVHLYPLSLSLSPSLSLSVSLSLPLSLSLSLPLSLSLSPSLSGAAVESQTSSHCCSGHAPPWRPLPLPTSPRTLTTY